MKAIDLYRVHAFTTSLTGGNPAGVCVLDEWLDDVVMQTIASENGWSETAFVLPQSDGAHPLRWFTREPLTNYARARLGPRIVVRDMFAGYTGTARLVFSARLWLNE